MKMTEQNTSKKSSLIWNHFTLSPCKTKATCVHCSQQLAHTSTSMSNLSRHTKRKHPLVNLDGRDMHENASLLVIDQEGDIVLKGYELTVNGFDDFNHETTNKLNNKTDQNWVAESEESLNLKTSEYSPSNAKKLKAKKSIIWNYFEKSVCGKFGRCLNCGNTIKLGTISNLARHLRNKHPTLANIRANFTNNVGCSFLKENLNGKIQTFTESEMSSELYHENLEDTSSQFQLESQVDESYGVNIVLSDTLDMVQSKTSQESQTEYLLSEEFDIFDYLKPKRDIVVSEHVDFQLVKMIVKGFHPLKIVEQSSFKDFVNILNPKYQLPDCNKICKEIIPELYKECEKNASKSLSDAEGIFLFIDICAIRETCYMSISAHFVNLDCKLQSVFLSCHILSTNESSSEISKRLQQTVSDWKISEKIIAVTTDDKFLSLKNAVKLCHWIHIPQFVQVINLALHECLQGIKSLVSKVKNHTEDLIQNENLLLKVYSTQRHLKLPQIKLLTTKDSNSRNSSFVTFEMLMRYVKLKTAICESDLPGPKMTDAEWRILTSVVETLTIFKSVKQEIAKEEKASLGKVTFYFRTLAKQMITSQHSKSSPSDSVYVAAIAEKSLNSKLKELAETDVIKNSLLLDPRLKKHVFENESESVAACSKLKKEVCEITLPDQVYKESDSNSIWHTFDNEIRKLNEIKDPIGKGILEFENYLQEQVLQRCENPLDWWNQRKSIYPRLYILARKYLCLTTRPCVKESSSYKCAYMLDNLKKNESCNLASQVMFLYHNMS